MLNRSVPTEDQEQATVVEWLQLHGIKFFHVPNGGARNVVTGARLKTLGTKRGVPDLIIVDPPPNCPDSVATAIEMKRQKGGYVTKEQREWLDILRDRGWTVAVCRGAGEAIGTLKALGYGKRRR